MKSIVARWAGPLALTATFLSARMPDSNAQEIDEAASFERFVQHRIPGMTREERDRRARTNGALRISGRVRARGKLFATSVHVEAGAEVDASGGLVLYSLGPIVIDGTIRGGAWASPKKDAPGSVGASGADGADITMISAQDITIGADLTGNPGGDGEDVSVAGPKGKGGDGGRGGDVTLRVQSKSGTIRIDAKLTPGRSGNGGRALVTGAYGAPGKPGQSVSATGGRCGDDGKLLIQSTNVIFGEGAYVQFPEFKQGGAAVALGGSGGDAPDCLGSRAGNGGNARAVGGRCGKGADVVVVAQSLEPESGASAFAARAAFAGFGGRAEADGGAGGSTNVGCTPSNCPAQGRNGSDGGSGGAAYARGGDGNVACRMFGPAFAGRVPAAVEGAPADGGNASAFAGVGRSGSKGERAERPGVGGKGGGAGASAAIGGRGGDCRVGVFPGGAAVPAGGGGDAEAGDSTVLLSAGDGGEGGDCCENSGGDGAAGGKGGVVRAQVATAGKAGKRVGPGVDGEDGAATVFPSAAGVAGGKGADCAGLAYVLTVFPTPPVHGQQTSFTVQVVNATGAPAPGLVVDLYLNGTRIARQTVDVPSGTEASPANRYISGESSAAKAGSNTFEVKVNGKSVGKVSFTAN